MIKHTHENIAKLADFVIDSWDLGSVMEYALEALQNEYTEDKDLFERAWSDNFGADEE